MPSKDPGFVESEFVTPQKKNTSYKYRIPSGPYKSSAAHKPTSGISHSDIHKLPDFIQDPFADWSPKLWEASALALDVTYRKDLY